MSKERSIVGTVILTVLVTAVVIGAGGWFVMTRYASQPTVTAPAEVVAAPAPTPKRKTPKEQKNAGTAAASQASGASHDAAPGGAKGPAEPEVAREDSDAASAAGRGTPPAAPENETPAVREESPAPIAAKPVAVSSAGEGHDDARTIMEEVQRRTEVKSYQYEGVLQSYDAKDKVTEKRWILQRLGSHGQSKSVVRFTTPAEVKGVALLIFNHPNRASDQWMWTPAIERDRRIAFQDRSTRFFGTDFTFEDLEERDVDQSDYSMLGADTVAGVACWKIQTTPKQTKLSQYSHAVIWIRKDNYLPARLDNFVKDEVVRRLTYSSVENIQGIWTARELEMSELKRGSRTKLTLQQIKYNVPMKDDDFTLQAIRHQ